MVLKDFTIDEWNKETIILLGGAGSDGAIIAKGLIKEGIQNFIICDMNKFGQILYGKKVISPNDLVQYPSSAIIISSSKYCIELYDCIKTLGISDQYIFSGIDLYQTGWEKPKCMEHYNSEYYQYQAGFMKLSAKIMQGWYLPHLDLVITEKCTLRCTKCAHLIPHYKNPIDFRDQDIISSFDRLLSTGCYIPHVCILGGEPFLNQESIVKILDYYNTSDQIGYFYITTNGTIIPNEKTIKAIKDNGSVFIIFSNYKVNSKLQEIAKLFDEAEIKYTILGDDIESSWIDYGEVRDYKRSQADNQIIFDKCIDGQGCYIILKGSLYRCAHIAHGIALGLIPNKKDNSVNLTERNIKNTEELTQECKTFAFRIEYPSGCEYCNKYMGKQVERANQIHFLEG